VKEEEAIGGDQILGEEERVHIEDYLGHLAYMMEQGSRHGGPAPLMLKGMDNEEATRLPVNASHEQPPRYAATVMPVGLSEEEPLRVAMEASPAGPPPSP
jgi:hypothetical protein